MVSDMNYLYNWRAYCLNVVLKAFVIRLIVIFYKINLLNKILFILLNIDNVSFYELYK